MRCSASPAALKPVSARGLITMSLDHGVGRRRNHRHVTGLGIVGAIRLARHGSERNCVTKTVSIESSPDPALVMAIPRGSEPTLAMVDPQDRGIDHGNRIRPRVGDIQFTPRWGQR